MPTAATSEVAPPPIATSADSTPTVPSLRFATYSAPVGNVGGITTPAQSVMCASRSYFGGASVQVTGSTPSAAISPSYYSQNVTADVYLLRYNSVTKAWVAIASRATSVAISFDLNLVIVGYGNISKLPTVSFSNLSPGYYSVQTLVTWWARSSQFGTAARVGYRWMNYNTAADYQSFQLGPAYLYAGYCYVK